VVILGGGGGGDGGVRQNEDVALDEAMVLLFCCWETGVQNLFTGSERLYHVDVLMGRGGYAAERNAALSRSLPYCCGDALRKS
jgi:hypothetical protein